MSSMGSGARPASFGRLTAARAFGVLLLLAPSHLGAQSSGLSEARARIAEMAADLRRAYPSVPVISADSLATALPSGRFLLVDVRSEKERRVSTLPGAITPRELERLAKGGGLLGREIVAYCTIGARSSSFARARARDGLRILNLEGSILDWTHAGGPLVRPDGKETKRVHVYSRRFNLIADGYRAVW